MQHGFALSTGKSGHPEDQPTRLAAATLQPRIRYASAGPMHWRFGRHGWTGIARQPEGASPQSTLRQTGRDRCGQPASTGHLVLSGLAICRFSFP